MLRSRAEEKMMDRTKGASELTRIKDSVFTQIYMVGILLQVGRGRFAAKYVSYCYEGWLDISR